MLLLVGQVLASASIRSTSACRSELLSRYHELARAHDELTRDLRDDLRPNWHVYLGKIALPARLDSAGFSWVYVGINLFAFAFGIVPTPGT
jgi:hypothetical protein